MCLTKKPSIRNWNLFSAYSQNLFFKVVIILGFHIYIRNMNDVLNVLKAESCLLVFNILRVLTPFFQYLNIGLLIFLILAYYSYYQPMKFMNTVNCGERNSRMLEHSLAEMIINISESFFNLRSKINQV